MSNLIGSYNYALVALSVLIAIVASYAALDLAGRVTAARDWTRAAWLLGGAGAMGTGIWSMHYIGMLAFILPVPVAYHWPTVLLSLFAAILASIIALSVVSSNPHTHGANWRYPKTRCSHRETCAARGGVARGGVLRRPRRCGQINSFRPADVSRQHTVYVAPLCPLFTLRGDIWKLAKIPCSLPVAL